MPKNRRNTTGSGQSQPEPKAAKNADERVVYTVPEAGRLLGLSRNGSYEAAKRGEIPTIRIGRLLLVPKVAFHRVIDCCRERDTDQEQRIQEISVLDRHGRVSGGAKS
jgi:excisionase family DNA binding protein